MAPMKRPAGGKNIVGSKCKEIASAIHETDIPERVQEMLAGSLSSTLGVLKASRHPFNERFVVMIGEIFEAHKATLEKTVSDKEAAVAALAPSKTSREEALEAAKATLTQCGEALDKAKQEVKDIAGTVKEAAATLKTKTAEQAEGDKVLDATEKKLATIKGTETDSLGPILAGDPEPEEKSKMLQAVMEASKTFSFDASLMEASVKVLEKVKADRGDGFDETCINQLKASFTTAIGKLEAELAEGAPGKAARAAAVEEATTGKASAEKTQEELKAAAEKAKEEKEAASEAVKAAKQALDDFVPDLKAAGDALDEAKASLEGFTEGALASYAELKDLTEDTFKEPEPEPSYYEVINGQRCDRAIIDACKAAVVGQGDGRVSVDDAKKVFPFIADGNRVTRVERWTLRYCFEAFKWTDAAHDWIVDALKTVPQADEEDEPAAKKAKTDASGYYEVVDGMKCDRGIVDACREAIVGQGDGRVSREEAEKVWAKAADGSGVTDTEKWTLRYCLGSFNFTRPAHDWLSDKLAAV